MFFLRIPYLTLISMIIISSVRCEDQPSPTYVGQDNYKQLSQSGSPSGLPSGQSPPLAQVASERRSDDFASASPTTGVEVQGSSGASNSGGGGGEPGLFYYYYPVQEQSESPSPAPVASQQQQNNQGGGFPQQNSVYQRFGQPSAAPAVQFYPQPPHYNSLIKKEGGSGGLSSIIMPLIIGVVIIGVIALILASVGFQNSSTSRSNLFENNNWIEYLKSDEFNEIAGRAMKAIEMYNEIYS